MSTLTVLLLLQLESQPIWSLKVQSVYIASCAPSVLFTVVQFSNDTSIVISLHQAIKANHQDGDGSAEEDEDDIELF